MPPDFRRYGESWAHHHPDWEMRLWTDTDDAALDCRESFARARDVAERSDVLRYEVLRRYGGVYVDTDLECRRPLDPLLEGVSAFTAYLRPGRRKIGTAIMGCVPNHPAFAHAAARVRDWVGASRTGDTGPWLMTEVVDAFPDITVFDAELFYPYHWTELYRRDSEFAEAYAVHHWSLRFLKKLEERREKVLDKNRRLEERLAETCAELKEQKRQRKELGARLKAIEGSRWWRSKVLLDRALARLSRLRSSNGSRPAEVEAATRRRP